MQPTFHSLQRKYHSSAQKNIDFYGDKLKYPLIIKSRNKRTMKKTLILSTHHNRILPTAQPYGERTGLCLCLRIRNR